MKKIYYKVYGRQKGVREVIGDVNAMVLAGTGNLATNVVGETPLHEGEADAETAATSWALIGESSAGGLAQIANGAFIKGEKGDTQPLAGGENPVISEKVLAELISFDVTTASWSTAAGSGTFGSMPLRQRLATIVTGVNVDLAFIDVRCLQHKVGGTYQNIYAWDVPLYVGIDAIAGESAKHPCSVDKEVSQLESEIDVYNCVVS